jgi:diguanylate cyclase (GGDEF)-like protein/PAS domain S-box-containing protein
LATLPKNQEALRAPGSSEARAVGLLFLGGAGLVALSLALPHPSGGDSGALVGTAVAMAIAGLACVSFAARISIPATHALLALNAALSGVLVYVSGIAAGQYGAIFVWGMLIAGYYFPRRIVLAHLAWILAIYAVTLAAVESTAGFSPVTRWLFTAISLSVVTAITTSLVARRRETDLRARQFFDLSQDMLCTADMDGYFVELNSAWQHSLGYTPAELRAQPFVELVHPEDRERTEAEAAGLFEGDRTVGFENRYLAKDGSWHWLRWSSTLSPDESVIYARATDVTELKLIESEREGLLVEVAALARHDALTGLPNRRAFEEMMPREMARARRSGAPLCLAIVDLDHFKAYNDSHGHLAGDVVLRECAIAWDSEVRGEDVIVRFGGEEFLVVLPGCPPEQATEIVERLRAATPAGQTCSAGLACWDMAESVDQLLGRADGALYAAKDGGRNRLAHAV